jgi:Viral BACON domain
MTQALWRLIFIFVIALGVQSLLPGAVSAQQPPWENVTGNLASMPSECGNLTMVSAVPEASTVIAGVATKGLWANSSGSTWVQLGTGASSATILNRPTGIAYDPVNPGVFWESGIYGTAGGVYKTTDSGSTFVQLGSVFHNDYISVDFADPGRQTLLTNGHEQQQAVYLSINGGQTWTNVGLNLPAGTAAGYPLVLGSQTYLAGAAPDFGIPGIYRTTNSGASWQQVSPLGPNAAPLGPNAAPLVASGGTIYWSHTDKVLKSTDSGLSWTQVGGGLQTGPSVAIIELSDGTLVAVGSTTLVRSADGGSTWSPIGPTLPFKAASLTYSATRKAFFISHWDCGNAVLDDAIMSLAYDPLAQPPTMTLDKTSLTFGAATTGAAFATQTAAQVVRVTQTGAGTVTWTATSNQPWLSVSPASGTGSATLTINVLFSSSVAAAGTATGAINLAFAGAANTAGPVAVSLRRISNGTTQAPTGAFDTPIHGTTGVTGSIPVTGWAIDDLEVTRVRILRDPVSGEGAAPVFIGNAVFVDGARVDIQTANPGAPRNTRAGWGYLMLTNFLPNQGNGTFKLYAYADDADGHTTVLGTKTIVCDNANAITPFGAIDTPLQGALVSGVVNNFGWVLAPGAIRADAPGGGTVNVVIDGVVVGTPAGWTSRTDLTTLFPSGFSDLTSTLAVFTMDTTGLTNGVHTIAWGVVANNGESAGVGSRYFTVSNGSGLQADVQSSGGQHAMGGVRSETIQASVVLPASMAAVRSHETRSVAQARSLGAEVNAALLDRAAISGRRGYDLDAPFEPFPVAASGRTIVRGEELDRFELRLSETDGDHHIGYMRVGTELHALPIGSRIEPATGVFTWAPGVGFVRAYDLVFVRWTDGQAMSRREVRFVLNPKGSNRRGPQITIDTPTANASVGRSFSIGGWAIDLDDRVGTGIDAVHVWAYPASGGDPVFLGATAYGRARPDVATIYGARFSNSGYGILVDSLPPGRYDVAVFAWSTVKNGFVPAKVVRVTVR